MAKSRSASAAPSGDSFEAACLSPMVISASAVAARSSLLPSVRASIVASLSSSSDVTNTPSSSDMCASPVAVANVLGDEAPFSSSSSTVG